MPCHYVKVILDLVSQTKSGSWVEGWEGLYRKQSSTHSVGYLVGHPYVTQIKH